MRDSNLPWHISKPSFYSITWHSFLHFLLLSCCVTWNKEEGELKNLFFICCWFVLSHFFCVFLDFNQKIMQLHISPSLRHVTVLPGKGLKEFIKVKVASRRLSYRMLFYSLLFFTFLLRFVFVLTAVDGIDGENKCSTIGTLFRFSIYLSHPHT